jgi:hypothetical protein
MENGANDQIKNTVTVNNEKRDYNLKNFEFMPSVELQYVD